MSFMAEEIESLKAPIAEEKIEALAKLGNMGDESVIEAIISTTADKSPLVRFHARRALAALRKRIGEDFIRVGMTITDSSGSFDPSSFRTALEHDNFMYRYTAVKGVEKLRDDAALPILAEIMPSEDNPIVRSAAVKAMAKVGGEMAMEELLLYLNDPDTRVRANTVEALASCGADVTDFLQPMLGDSDARVRANTIVALHGRGGIGLPDTAAIMARGDKGVRESLMWALEQINDREMVEALKILMVSDDSTMRSRAEKLAVAAGIRSESIKHQSVDSYDDDESDEGNGGETSARGSGKSARGSGRGSGEGHAPSRGRSSGKSRGPSAIVSIFKVIAFLIVLGAMGYGAFFYYQRFDQDRDYSKAVEMMEQNRLEQAVMIFRRLGDYRDSRDMLRKVDSLAVMNKAENYLRKSMFREAIDTYREAARVNGVDVAKARDGLRKSLLVMVKDRRDSGDVDGAVRWCDEALTTFPQDSHFINAKRDTLMDRSRELISKGLFGEAIVFIKTLPEKGVREGVDRLLREARIQYGKSLDRAGRVDEAIAAYRDILSEQSLAASSGDASGTSGDTAGSSGDAGIWMNEIEDSLCRLIGQKILSLVKGGDSLAGLILARESVKAHPKRSDLISAMTVSLREEAMRMAKMGDVKRSINLIDEAEKLSPGDSEVGAARSQISALQQSNSNPEDRNRTLRRAIEYILATGEKDTPQGKERLAASYSELALIFLSQTKLEEATAIYREALKNLPENRELSKSLSDVYLRLGDDRYASDLFDEAHNFYSLAVKAHSSPEARKALESTRIKDTYLSYLSGDYERAEEGFRKILGEEPKHVKARQGLALCLKERGDSILEKGKFQDAFTLFSEAHELNSETPGLSKLLSESATGLARELGKNGKFEDAASILNRARQMLPDNAPIQEAVTALYVAKAEQENSRKLALLEQERQRQNQIEQVRREKIERENRLRAETARELEYRGKVFFNCADDRGDDKGPGTYRYPRIPGMEDGAFDIIRAEAVADGDHVLFRITFDRTVETSSTGSSQGSSGIDDRSGRSGLNWRRGENGWVFQMIDIYIDTDRKPGSGETRTLPGRNLSIDPAFAWEKMILISPLSASEMDSYINSKVNNSDLLTMKKRIIIPRSYSVQGSVISARVPLTLLGKPGLDWAWQFMVMGYADIDSPVSLRNMDVSDGEDATHFGGGTSYQGNTNVIDILTPKGSNQFRILSDYVSRPDSRQSKFAVVPLLDWDARTP